MKATVVYSVTEGRWVFRYAEGSDPMQFQAAPSFTEVMPELKPTVKAGQLITAHVTPLNPQWVIELELN